MTITGTAALIAATLVSALPAAAASPAACPAVDRDLLDVSVDPRAKERPNSLFFDSGAWFGFGLPASGGAATGFVGPYLLAPRNGEWAGQALGELRLADASGAALPLTAGATVMCPGTLERTAKAGDVAVRQTLFYNGSERALVRVELSSSTSRALMVGFAGQLTGARVSDAHIATDHGEGAGSEVRLINAPAGRAVAQGDGAYSLSTQVTLSPGRPTVLFLEHRIILPGSRDNPSIASPEAALLASRARWAAYLADARRFGEGVADTAYNRRVAAKAVVTLIGNWRTAYRDLPHDGLFPSYANRGFNGFWSWDSWKHATALARFAPALARDQIRSLFAYQNDRGMIPDVIYADKSENNWRDTKPPLAAWAVEHVYRSTNDRAFVAEMFDRLLAYHRWWYTDRDHDRNGLAEYGSTDGTRIAAAWESGMDNAVRFDAAKMVRNRDGAWSLDQESVDLNAYLFAEKRTLARLADVLGRSEDAARLRREADVLGAAVKSGMFSAADGYFVDRSLASGKLIRVLGPEGWTPLWAGVADQSQAGKVAAVMVDPRHFGTHVPLGTLSASHPEFSPVKGYWRGPVWMDQAYFGVAGLERYGLKKEAAALRDRLLRNVEGLDATAPMYENYDPLTGKGYQSPNFSWAAAHFLMLLWNEPELAS